MGDSTASAGSGKLSPVNEGSVKLRAPRSSSVINASPARDDQPTIISSRQPLPPLGDMSESTCRILQGKILPGDRLGHFDLLEYIGGGGMGRVYRALDTRLARTVALKILSSEQMIDDDTRMRFQNEAQSAARLDHENIARVYYVGEDRGVQYIVFEFIDGVNVRTLVEREGPLELTQAVSYTLQVAEALAHAAQRDVVHRDIKPSNVLIASSGRVKLIDMGLARFKQADPAAADLTASGVTLGTFDYISPEQARDPRNADTRSDIYSLGCTFFFMLTGRPPFPEGTVLQKLLQHQGDRPPDVRQLRPDLPEQVGRILEKMLAKEPRRRYAQPAELVADLIDLSKRIGLRLTLRPENAKPAGKKRSHWEMLLRQVPWLAPAVILLGVVLLINAPWTANDDRLDGHPILLTGQEGPNGAAENESSAGVDDKLFFGPGGFTFLEQSSEQNGKYGFWPWNRIGLASNPAANAAGSAAKAKSNPAAANSKVLVVTDLPVGENQYGSLASACDVAADGDAIELRFNGPREERSLRLFNRRLTIRAGKHFQPVVVYHPVDPDPVKSPRAMISLAGGQLAIADVALELRIPREVAADNWSLFEVRAGQSIRLERCVMTVNNASDQLGTYHPDAAFFRVMPAADIEMSKADVVEPAGDGTKMELIDCVARGEAAFLRAEKAQGASLSWSNGLLAVNESLLVARGGQEPPDSGDMLRLDLSHLTAALGGLCLATDSQLAPYQLPLQMQCSDCIFVNTIGRPLLEQDGAADAATLGNRVWWRGEDVFFEGFDVFWLVDDYNPESPPDIMYFDDWCGYWNVQAEGAKSLSPLNWKNPLPADRSFHALTPNEFLLDDAVAGNPAVGAARDGGDAGLNAKRLPKLE
jgi:serine/threonine protein kinase